MNIRQLTSNKQLFRFSIWSSVSNCMMSAQYAITTHNVLNTVMGNSSMYLIKDIIGQFGGLMYIIHKSKNIDTKPKYVLKYSDILQQTSFGLLMISQNIPSTMFIYVASISSICMNISFIGYGSLNIKYISDLTNKNEIGYNYTLISCLNTLSSTIGMIIGVIVNTYVTNELCRMIIVSSIGVARVFTFRKSIQI
jgi:hypothetical protein